MKLAFITPRYGAEFTAGPEHACRLLAEQLAERHDVDVLTTTTRDPLTWKNESAEGSDTVRGVFVRRFAVNQPHDRTAFRQFSERLHAAPHSRSDELEWVRRLGPSAPGLIEHLKRQHRGYDALVFFSLQHATTVNGFAIAPERSIIFPHARYRPDLRFGLWREMLDKSRAIGLLSAAERPIIRDYIRATAAPDELVGIGIDPLPQQTYPRHQQDPADALTTDEDAPAEADEPDSDDYLAGRGVPFRRRHRLYGPLAVYGGRIETDNGSEEMLEYFDSYAAANGDAALVLMGAKMIKVQEESYLRFAGILPDRDRMIAYGAADVTLAPEFDDLVAQPVLESLAVGTPVLVNARNAAAAEHCRRSSAGLYYANRGEFIEALRLLMTNTRLRERLGRNGCQYVRDHYRWEAVLGRFERLLTKVKNR